MTPFTWKGKSQDVQIETLQDLLNTVVKIPLPAIDSEITENVVKGNLLEWIETNFPKKIILLTSVRSVLQEYTPQQIREKLIRELRK